jgi:large-conductance mechanosensitive channel
MYLQYKQLNMNWFAIVIVAILVIALVVFLVVRNIKDEKDYEQQANQDYHHSKDVEGDVDEDTALK